MNKKEKVLEIVNDVITEKITGIVEEMSTNEFFEIQVWQYTSQDSNFKIGERRHIIVIRS
jgi:hypothetical protein